MKLVIYLPALNEAATIAQVLDSIPNSLPGISDIEKIVVDDGSTDGTAAIAAKHGATLVRHDRNLGTGRTFVSGVTAALDAGADLIVSMDADGQFRGADLQKMVQPLLSRRADIVLCTRFGDQLLIGPMTAAKRAGNWLLVSLISAIAGRKFTDVSCGFRAFTRDAALRIDIHSDYEYIHESLLNWSRGGMRIAEVSLPVLAERPVGKSRIMSSVLKYAVHSAPVLTRAIRDYSPMKFFGFVSFVIFVISCAIGLGVFSHWLQTGQTIPYTQFITVSVGGVLLSFLLGMMALMADLIGRLRFQVEELLYESRKLRTEHKPGSHRAA